MPGLSDEVVDPPPYTEIGRTGDGVPSWGQLSPQSYDEEEVPALRWPESSRVYHRMRTDSQIDSLSKSVTLPVRRMRWLIDPNGARDEVVQGISEDLGLAVVGQDPKPLARRRRFNHDDHLRHALLGLFYGHMFFEMLGYVDGDLRWRLSKLAPRMPMTLTRIDVASDGGLNAIWQRATQDQLLSQPAFRPSRRNGVAISSSNVIPISSNMFGQVEIPVDYLAAYVWDREGGNWAGRSLYRPLYRHWLVKDRLIRVDTLKHERFGAGIPTGRAPAGGDVAEYQRMAAAIRASDTAGVGLPQNADVFVEGVRGSIPNTIESIRYHDEVMARSFLAMFLQLGQTTTGSRALGGTFVDFFELSLDAIANWYSEVTSEHVIEDWVDWNYGVEEPAPKLVWERDVAEPPGTQELTALIDAGLLTVDDGLREWVTKRYQLPEQPTLEEEQKMKADRAAAFPPPPAPPPPVGPADPQQAPQTISS